MRRRIHHDLRKLSLFYNLNLCNWRLLGYFLVSIHCDFLNSTCMSGNGGRRQRKLSRLKISTRFYYFSLFRYTSWYSLLNRSYLSVILYFIFFKTNSLLLQSRVSQSVHARNIKGNTTRFRSRHVYEVLVT